MSPAFASLVAHGLKHGKMTARQIKQQAGADIARLRAKVNEARQQLAMPFYNVKG